MRHLIGHLGVSGGDVPVGRGVRWTDRLVWPLGYVGAAVGMFGPMLALAMVGARRWLRSGATSKRRAGVVYLLCCAGPILVFYFAVSFVAEPEQNWAIAGMVSLMVLAGWFAAEELARRRWERKRDAEHANAPRTPPTRSVQVLWRLGIMFGVVGAALLHRADVAAAMVNRVAGTAPGAGAFEQVAGRPWKPIVTGRLIGACDMAAHVAREIDRLDAGDKGAGGAFVMCEHYGRASQMAYELFRAGREDVIVLSSQSIMGGRRSQFDLWPETDLARADLAGCSALLMSNDQPHKLETWKRMFDRVEPLDAPGQRLAGEHKKDRVAYVGYGYLPARGSRREEVTRPRERQERHQQSRP